MVMVAVALFAMLPRVHVNVGFENEHDPWLVVCELYVIPLGNESVTVALLDCGPLFRMLIVYVTREFGSAELACAGLGVAVFDVTARSAPDSPFTASAT
jgi:hypothetical protein